jgi:hypothetical protein
MLNIGEIASRIAQPSGCQSDRPEDLEQLIHQFPYAQCFPILYLKTLKLQQDIRFDAALETYAYCITDREQLYALMTEVPVETTIQDDFTQPNKEIVDDASSNHENEDINTETTPPENPKTTTNSDEGMISRTDEPFTIPGPLATITLDELEGEETGIVLHISSDAEKIEKQPSEKEASEIEKFERELLSEAISSAYNLDHLKTEHETIPDESEPLPALTLNREKNEQIIDKKGFTDWLRSNESMASDMSYALDEAAAASNAEPIAEKQPFFSPTQIAKESLSTDKMPVSETLAKIFAAQGNFPRAISAYEQLMLKIPEKKVYFASQIEQLHKKLKV